MASQVGTSDFAHGPPDSSSPLSQTNLHNQNAELDHTAGSSTLANSTDMQTTPSSMSQSHTLTPSRGGTLKKRQSLSRKNSLRRAGSKKGSRPGSVRSLTFADDVAGSEANSVFYTPVPTHGNPTQTLANRFDAWRKILKDLITYFRDLQKSYDARSKSLYTLSNVMSNISAPPGFMAHGGISEAVTILRDYHKKAISESNKAKQIEEDVIVQLSGLRSDLGQKIKEIKSLSGDFKNNVDKETDITRRAVTEFQHALEERHPDAKNDPFLIKLSVDRQVGRQIEEENYLHTAFLNLESSGRELESIVVGEIQKAYTAYSGILKREADETYEAVDNLHDGPLALPKDGEWNSFVSENDAFVDPRIAVRKVENITYPGKDDPAAMEVKAGMLERKSKYLKSYTPGWYVLSPTHLHEFKSPDRIATQTPVMSLPLSDQKLGSHSNPDSSSHKFMLKGRQSGGMHKSHAWVFRAESYDTMMAWFSDIKTLTEKSGVERDAFIRRTHARSVSGGSHHAASISDGSALDEDEADHVPYSAAASQPDFHKEDKPQRPNPGGRFPSLLSINRDSQVPHSPSSTSENSGDREVVAAASALPGAGLMAVGMAQQSHHQQTGKGKALDGTADAPVLSDTYSPGEPKRMPFSPAVQHFQQGDGHSSNYGDWMAPAAAAGAGGVAVGAAGVEAYRLSEQRKEDQPGLQAVDGNPTVQGAQNGTIPISQSSNGAASELAAEHLADPSAPIKELADRPPLGSVPSGISVAQLHVPGEFPPPSRTTTQQL